MSEYLGKLIYLTRAQYNTLAGGGTVGSQTGLNNNYLYYTTDENLTAADLSSDFILPVSKGGTGKTQFTAGSLLIGNGTGALGEVAATNLNTASTVVKRDASGNFSANEITAAVLTAVAKVITTGGQGLLAYKPSGWTGVTTSQWGVGTVDIQGVIRSNNSDLLHSRAGTNSVILDASNYTTYTVKKDGTGASGSWGISITGNAATATKATKDGDNNTISSTYLKLAGGTMTGALTTTGITISNTDANVHLGFSRTGGHQSPNYINVPANGSLAFSNGGSGGSNIVAMIDPDGVVPFSNNTKSIGTSTYKWASMYATTFYGALSGNATTATTASILSCPNINTETSIESGTRSYQGGGDNWTGSMSSMQYAGILQVCGGYSRGWQIWSGRGTSSSLHWRNPNDDATAWTTERVILDSSNYSSYALPLSGGQMTGAIGFGASSMNRAILQYNSTYPKYGIWYSDAAVDKMRFSASGNADTDAGADLCINGNGDGTVTIRGNTILHAGNYNSYALPLSGGVMTGWIFFDAEQGIFARIKRKTPGGGGWAYSAYRYIDNANNTFAHIGVYGSADTMNYMYIGAGDYDATTNLRITPAGTVSATKVYGAVWNDYAEYRTTKNIIEPGRCVIETGKDDLVLSTERLQPGAEIVSDTYGFAIGKTDEAKTPIATTGRVLAYIYEGREAAQTAIGKPVCSGPDGTVSIMTDEEYQKYGYCAIGTISAVPDYEEWGTGKVKVNNRIWIRIR